ncbi:MAG: FkbM family methyltransferase [Flavobacterium sp.]|jgi:FkbM family methyltransferase|uniref:FkbM family methyltransferase n=1 Tax=unclassified Flavobacterium TaxID=196869 RepID=UPI0024A9FB33|nr:MULTISPECIES: FkbM family methyltransferase [unclassified Flavobacterium]MDI6049171.1 FkbM family methyltransferase [Flavobacterium sp. XS2P24]MDP3679664.1 FkbM family methyltransferase [Flavobacterium sp.]MDZ4331088.1 FkbM family methyltransferase [Flavobacterium sp.]
MSIKNIIKNLFGINNIKFVKSWFISSNEKILIEQRRDFYSQFLKPGSVFFDIGANYGNRIEPLINDNVKIIAIEPQIECVRYLRKKYGKKITILQNGVGEEIKTQLMYISTNANILSSFSKDWIDSTKNSGRFKKINWNKTREIEMITLDYLIMTYGKPDFIKIDVEGFELQVLKGLTQNVNVLSLEYTVPERKDALIDCLLYLNNLSSSNVSFNYCITENTEFVLPQWVDFNEMIILVNTDTFLNTQFGDVYVKFNQ